MLTAIKPVTFAAFPAMSPETLDPATPSIFPFVIAKSAMSSVAMLRSSIFALLIALFEITGADEDELVPAKSPANCNLPLIVALASAMFAEDI